jgi:hypothetical protein
MDEHLPTSATGPAPDARATRDREIERALASIPGVVSARVDRPGGSGSAHLRLRLRPAQDRDPVARSVAVTLEERFGIAIDPAAIRVASEPAAAPAPATAEPMPALQVGPLVARRASITHLDVVHDMAQVYVTIGLARNERRVEGSARATLGVAQVLRAVADATVEALEQLTIRPIELEVLGVDAQLHEHPARMLVAVRLREGQGDEDLLGAALVRDDPEHAVVRATLDAVNRRVEPLLPGAPSA